MCVFFILILNNITDSASTSREKTAETSKNRNERSVISVIARPNPETIHFTAATASYFLQKLSHSLIKLYHTIMKHNHTEPANRTQEITPTMVKLLSKRMKPTSLENITQI